MTAALPRRRARQKEVDGGAACAGRPWELRAPPELNGLMRPHGLKDSTFGEGILALTIDPNRTMLE